MPKNYAKYKKKYRKEWENLPDFRGWLTVDANDNDRAFCTTCKISLRPHKTDLLSHLKKQKHKLKFLSINPPKSQTNLNNNVVVICNELKKHELIIAAHIAVHSSIRTVDHLTNILHNEFQPAESKSFASSAITMKLHRTKCTMIIENVIAAALKDELITDIGNSSYSLIIDESTDISVHQYLCFCVRYFSEVKAKVVTTFLGIVEVKDANAVGLANTLTDYIRKIGLKLENLLALATDGASVLCGSRNSVFTILKAAVPKLISVKCIAHSLHLCCSKAASVLPDELDFLCKHIYNWFARSHQRRECYIEVFETININEKNIKFNKFIQLSETRWLERANVIKVILQQWLEIKTYFTQVANTTKDTMGKVILGMLTDINFVYFTIIYNILVQVNIVNAAFQQTNGDAFQLYKELYQLLLTFLGIVIRPIFLENLTELKSSCVNKICEILQNELSYIQINIIDFAYNYRQAIVNNNLKLTDIEKIRQNSQHFVLTLCRELTKRIPQNLEVFYSIKYFSPEICLKQINRPKFDNLPLNILDDNLSKQDFENEWNNLLAVNWNLEKDISSHNFWVKVLEYQNAGGVHIYANIAKFALTTLTLPISNAFVERIFSFMNTIKTKFRNKINIPLLEALLRIKTEFVINDTCCHKFVPSKAMFQKCNATMYNFKKQAEGDVNDELVDIFSETEF
ncbi:hat family dimerization domaincontaining protein-related [Holotrichia oblita]|uniref:Hat family dimerization domaincontaining protein-related n=1 Tax=Holotrichia oblita TaxID=644536 RepID=A0ACB9SG87_HOLOL|nr:hat family dimerization domaincontaining protein-related [Holotrichia oblita]